MIPYHIPVLLKESIDALVVRADGVYVDSTYGGGGHARHIMKHLDAKGHLLAFDQDEDVLSNLIEGDERFTFIPQNFRHLERYLRLYGHRKVDGILADLGVSSHQLDEAARGFSFRFAADLDMRMHQQGAMKASDLLHTMNESALQTLFSEYGEVRNSKTLAAAIVQYRSRNPLKTIEDFMRCIEPHIKGDRNRYLAQVFQSLRIAVNDEMGALQDFLQQCAKMLRPGGRLVVISYHSLEDKLVKQFMKTGSFTGDFQKDFYGNIYRPFQVLTKKSVVPSDEEIRLNPRSRSAKLRVAERVEDPESKG